MQLLFVKLFFSDAVFMKDQSGPIQVHHPVLSCHDQNQDKTKNWNTNVHVNIQQESWIKTFLKQS